jgi:spore coat polysaccharide biosynthesis protein SpsF
MPSIDQAVEIVRLAVDSGVPFIDTAHIYGESEERIGEAFARLDAAPGSRPTVVTKIGMIDMVDAAKCPDAAAAEAMVDASFETSQQRLQSDPLDTVLLHNFAGHSQLHGGAPFRRLVALRDQGLVKIVGVSLYEPEEALEALRDPDVGHIQLPFNLLDGRWKTDAFAAAAAARPDVTIHTRSCFLQGILVSGAERWPPFTREAIAPRLIAALEELTSQLGRRSRLDLCLAYSRGLPWITQVLAGSETAAQLQETIELFQSTSALTAAEIATVDERLAQLAAEGCIPPRLLNAGEWIDPEDIEASKGHDMAQGLYQGPGSKLKLTTANL